MLIIKANYVRASCLETKIINEGLGLGLILKRSTMPVKKSVSNPNPSCSAFHLTHP